MGETARRQDEMKPERYGCVDAGTLFPKHGYVVLPIILMPKESDCCRRWAANPVYEHW